MDKQLRTIGPIIFGIVCIALVVVFAQPRAGASATELSKLNVEKMGIIDRQVEDNVRLEEIACEEIAILNYECQKDRSSVVCDKAYEAFYSFQDIWQGFYEDMCLYRIGGEEVAYDIP